MEAAKLWLYMARTLCRHDTCNSVYVQLKRLKLALTITHYVWFCTRIIPLEMDVQRVPKISFFLSSFLTQANSTLPQVQSLIYTSKSDVLDMHAIKWSGHNECAFNHHRLCQPAHHHCLPCILLFICSVRHSTRWSIRPHTFHPMFKINWAECRVDIELS